MDDPDPNWCPRCGEPNPHFRDGMCERCWWEVAGERSARAARSVIEDAKVSQEDKQRRVTI